MTRQWSLLVVQSALQLPAVLVGALSAEGCI
jgi:hypothetical protein